MLQACVGVFQWSVTWQDSISQGQIQPRGQMAGILLLAAWWRN